MNPGAHRSFFLLSPLLVFCFCTLALTAQDSSSEPRFLVARPGLPNVLFERSVILMMPHDPNDDLVVGLMVNKPTHRTLAEVFPKESALRNRKDTVYFGGPVDMGTPGVVLRARKPVKKAIHVFDDVYASFDADFIVDVLKKAKPDDEVRLFLGRAQWGKIQLENEMRLHAWYSERADSSFVFSPKPEDVWRILVDREQPGPMAWLGHPALRSELFGAQRLDRIEVGGFAGGIVAEANSHQCGE